MSDCYQRSVCAYLASEWGSDTPSNVAARLLRLRPETVGMCEAPSLAALHAMRSFLQVVSAEETKEAC